MASAGRRVGVVVAVALTVLAVILGFAALRGVDGSAGRAGPGDAARIGLLLPVTYGRWETFDRPGIERAVAERCPDCVVESANAQGQVDIQQQQVESMITRGVDVLIIAPVDARAISSSVERARDAGIPVVAYDRLAEGPIAGYVSFDNVQVGRLMGKGLLRALGDRAATSDVVMMNGDPGDPNAGLVRQGALDVLTDRVRIVASYDTLTWSVARAYSNMSGAIVDLGPDRVDGVLAASDSLSSGVLAALKAANVEPLPPVTGQDADLDAIQHILLGEQYMTVYKPFGLEATPAAEMALELGRGHGGHGGQDGLADVAETSVANETDRHIPAVLARPISVTADTVAETVVKDGLYTAEQICVPQLAHACERAGLTGQGAA
jgi:D-xylose transport system substrate-binding protein